MSRTIYLDSNQLFRVFERERATLLDRVSTALRASDSRLVASDAYFVEVWKGLDAGADPAIVRSGLEELDRLNPIWMCLAWLPKAEIKSAFLQFQAGNPITPYNPFLDWPGMVSVMNQEQATGSSGCAITPPMSEAVFANYTKGCLEEGTEERSEELDAASAAYRRILDDASSNIRARKDSFIELVMNEVSPFTDDKALAERFVKELLRSPNLCPAFSLSVELSILLLEDRSRRWDYNTFFDYAHAFAIPYVDAFAAHDGGLRHAIETYDRRVLIPAGLEPYSPRVYRTVEEALSI